MRERIWELWGVLPAVISRHVALVTSAVGLRLSRTFKPCMSAAVSNWPKFLAGKKLDVTCDDTKVNDSLHCRTLEYRQPPRGDLEHASHKK